MNLRRHFLRPFTTIAAGLLALVACQNATDSNSNNDKPVVVTATFPIAAPRIPDSASWIFLKDTTVKVPNCPPVGSDGTTICTETFDLPRPLGTDSVALQLWTLGIQTYTLYFKESGSSTTLDYGSHSVVSLDTLLLSLYANLTSTQKAALAPSDSGRSGLVAYYASLILSGDTAFAGKPMPVGVSADSVKKDLVLQGIAGGKTSVQLGNLNMGLDTASIRNIAAILVQANLLKTADTLDWFHPVRVSGAASLAGSLTAGGGAVNVNGVFSWNAGVKVSLAPVTVHTPQGVDNPDFQFPTRQFVPGSTDTLWSLLGNLTVQALATAAVGWDTLWVTLSTDSTHAATLRIPFQVVAALPTTPKIVLLSPANQIGNALAQGTDSLFVSWGVSNWGDVNPDSVFINSLRAIALTDSTWGQNVYVDPNGQVTTITFRALGKNGSAATSFVQVTRAKDTIGPSIAWLNPSASISVDATVSSYKVQVKATDLSGVDSVYLQGTMAKNDSGSYWSSTISLPTPNGVPVKVVAKAWDKLKNLSVDSTSITLTRNAPSGTDKPALTLLQPASNVGNSLPFASDTLHVVYKITDVVPLDTATILFGTTVPKRLTDSTWEADVPVPSTGQPTIIVIQVANTNKVGNSDQIVVIRAKDTVPPNIVPLAGTISRAVIHDTASATLSWTVSDNYKMYSITLNGAPIALTSNVIENVPLAVGVNPFVLVATDTFGNTTKDSIAITRGGDVTPPTIISKNGGATLTLPNATTTFTASWKVKDDVKMGTVTISDTVVSPASDSTYSLLLHLSVGTRKVAIVASDSAGNKSTDTLVVIRSAPAPSHSIQSATGQTGNFIGTVYDTLVSAGADSIEYSMNGTNWFTYSGCVTVSDTGLHSIYARAFPGGALGTTLFEISQIKQIAVGNYHTAIVKTDGSLWTTGMNNHGQLGTGDNNEVSSPVRILPSGVASVAAGYYHTLVLKTDGSLYETGYNGDGELGNGSQADLLTLTKIADNVSSVGAGLYHSLYVTTGGVLMGSGINNMGQLGTATASYFTSFQQMDIGVGSVVASGGYTLYLKGAGRLYGCGTNASGELGRTDTTTLWSPTLLDSNVNGISAGWMFSLRTKSSNSTLWGTGDDEYGQLGNNSFSNVYTPIQIALGPILSMATGYSHSLVVTLDGSLYTMGDNVTGESGCGSAATVSSPTKVMTGVAQVFAGGRQSFVLKTDGTLWVSGRSTDGELGIGSLTTLYTFQRLNF